VRSTGLTVRLSNSDIPFDQLPERVSEFVESYNKTEKGLPVYAVCRRGNDSQIAVGMLKEHGIVAKDIIGGLIQWSKQVDVTFPTY
jgi:adenylyltransferase and sulfurtransferase